MASKEIKTSKGETRYKADTHISPFSAIAFLEFFYEGSPMGVGTGFLVQYENTRFIVTAAHCFLGKDSRDTDANRVQVSFGINGVSRPFGTFNKRSDDKKLFWSKAYTQNEPDPHDYGIILLDNDINLPTVCFTFKNGDDSIPEETELKMSGYPAFVYEKENGVNRRVRVDGLQFQTQIQLETDPNDHDFLCYKDATHHGNSGSPIYYEENGHYIAVGVHCMGIKETGMNYGVRISEVVKADLKRMYTGSTLYSGHQALSPGIRSGIKRHVSEESAGEELMEKEMKY